MFIVYPPIYPWHKDGVLVNSTNFIDVTDYSLKIKYLRTEDSGRYDCVGENMGGAVTVSLEVR